MNRRSLLAAALGAGISLASPVLASEFDDALVAQLRGQGYTDISVTRTLLGRIRIFAVSARFQREIIVNPRTGEILRDYWEALAEGSGAPQLIDPSKSGSGSGSNSGSGSSGSGGHGGSGGNSGSGGGGSGGSGSGGSGSGGGSDDDDDDD